MNRNISLFACSLFVLTGCSDDDTSPADPSGTSTSGASGGAGGTGAGGGGGTAGDGSGGAGGAAPSGTARVAHLSPDAPAVDFCVSADASNFIGPVLAGAGDADGLAFREVTAYLPLPAATYTARLVAPGSSDCATALGGLPDVGGIVVDAAGAYTLAAVGMLTPAGADAAFSVRAYADDTEVDAAKAKLRFIHASPDTPSVDVGTGSGEAFAPVFTNVPFGSAGEVAGSSYLVTDPLSGVTLSARATGATQDALVIEGVDLPATAIATAFAIGNLDGDPADLAVLLCVDNGRPTDGLTPCLVVP